MMKSGTTFGLPALVLGSALGLTAFAQTSTTPTQTTDQSATSFDQHDQSERQHDVCDR